MDDRHIDDGIQRLKDLLRRPMPAWFREELENAIASIEKGVLNYDDVISDLEQRRNNDDNFPGGIIGWLDDDFD